MDQAAQERFWLAKEVLEHLSKLLASLKLYPSDHHYCDEARSAFARRLRSFLTLHNVLRLSVDPEGLRLDGGEPVYLEPNKAQNLAFRLYVDGIRELWFGEGVLDEEVRRFGDALHGALQDVNADSAALLWDAKLEAIDFSALNSLSEAWEAPEGLSLESSSLLEQMNERVDAMISEFEQRQGGVSGKRFEFDLSDGGAEIARVEERAVAIEDAEEAEDEDAQTYAMFELLERAEAAKARLRPVFGAWQPDRVLRSVVSLSTTISKHEPELFPPAAMAKLYVEAAAMALRSRDLSLTARILQQGLRHKELTVRRTLETWLEAPAQTEQLVRIALQGGLGGVGPLLEVLELLGHRALSLGVEIFRESRSAEVRQAFEEPIARWSQKDPEPVSRLIRDPDPETARTGLFLASRSTVASEELEPLIQLGLEHPEPEVRRYAEHLFRTHTASGKASLLLAALDAPEREERLRVLRLLLANHFEQAVPDLRARIEAPSFLQKDAEERDLFLATLAGLGGMKVVGFLQSQTERRVTLRQRRAALELREQAKGLLKEIREGLGRG